MDFVENVRISEECAETGFGAEVDRSAAIFGARKIGGIGIAENPAAECDKARISFGRTR